MKLSIVIPARNEEHYIGACLDSIMQAIAAEPRDVEIIVSDNGSTDHTREVASRYPGVRVIEEPKRGANAAREAGFRVSSGDLIANLDADTRINAQWISRACAAFEADEHLAAITGPYRYLETSPTEQWMITIYYFIAYLFALISRITGIGAVAIGGNIVIRRSALLAVGGYNTAITFYGDDTDTAKRLARVGTVRFDLKLVAPSSNRRLATEGTLAMGVRYVLNYLWVTVTGKPYTTRSTDIRR